mmetsp:Transcript_20155/g.34319  ORF Transcript_20155/g.34319 Transcript_20155/m.34319 type:complete len:80 (-) Transcript_20155:12-251(-)
MMFRFAFIVASLGAAVLAKEGYYTTDTAKQEFMFNQFLREYGRSYDSTEYPKRLQIFVNNLKLIDERNLKEKGSAKHGM